MCMPKPPQAAPPPPPPAALVPLTQDVSKPAVVDTEDKASRLRRSGRSRLTVPSASSSATTGMSGLNIPN